MRRRIKEKVTSVITELEIRHYVIASVGAATFFFGFAAGAILNLYLLAIRSPLALQYRTVLSYKSAIFGDGIILPIINMVAISFLLKNKDLLQIKLIQVAMLSGIGVTIYFHVHQGLHGLVNWAMPSPWQWNFLGLWHAIYMFSVATFLSLFYLLIIKTVMREKNVPKEALLATLGLIAFFFLLRLDYISIDLTLFIPRL